jgi:hypothetical protein
MGRYRAVVEQGLDRLSVAPRGCAVPPETLSTTVTEITCHARSSRRLLRDVPEIMNGRHRAIATHVPAVSWSGSRRIAAGCTFPGPRAWRAVPETAGSHLREP